MRSQNYIKIISVVGYNIIVSPMTCLCVEWGNERGINYSCRFSTTESECL